jgi:hypothetical protein
VNTLYYLEEGRGEQRISPPGDKFTQREQNSILDVVVVVVCVFLSVIKVKKILQYTEKKKRVKRDFKNKFNSIFYSALSAGQNVPAELKSSEGVK